MWGCHELQNKKRKLPHTIHYTLYTIHYTLYTIHYTLYTTHYTLYTIHYTLYTIHYTLYTIQYTLYTIHYTLYTVHYTLYTIHYTRIQYNLKPRCMWKNIHQYKPRAKPRFILSGYFSTYTKAEGYNYCIYTSPYTPLVESPSHARAICIRRKCSTPAQAGN